MVVSSSPLVSTQVSALLPPRCMEAMSAPVLATLVRPPRAARARNPAPSLMANTRSISERGTMWPLSRWLRQVGICDSGM